MKEIDEIGHGNQWDAVLGQDWDLVPTCGRIVEHGKLVGKSHLPGSGFSRPLDLFALAFPPNAPLQYLALLEARTSWRGAQSNEVYSVYPWCAAGCENELEIVEVYAQKGRWRGEGGLQLSTNEGGLLWAVDPHFYANSRRYEVGQRLRFSLAGLAYTMARASTAPIIVREGAMLELHRMAMLERDPGIDPAAIDQVELSTKGARGFFPNQKIPLLASTYRAPVDGVEWFDVDGTRFAACSIMIIPEDEVRLIVYASELVLDGYEPKPGDEIEGLLWLQASPVTPLP